MSINLTKGQKINLSKEAGGGLTEIMVGLGWDPAKRGLFRSIGRIDCDASAIILRAGGGVEDCVYYGHLSYSGGKVQHHGDNLTGDGEGDDEQITVKLSSMPDQVERIVFVVNIYCAHSRNQDFGMIANAFIRLVDQSNKKEICRYNLSGEQYNGKTAMIFGEVYRKDGEWKFSAIGQGTTDDSINDLVKRYR